MEMVNGNNSAPTPSSSGKTSTHQALQGGLPGVCQNAQPRSDIVGSPFGARELMIAREMEKKRIREEIITSGLLRRRELEAEVIRELMMEREIFMRQEGDGLSMLDSLLRPEVQGYGFRIGIGEKEKGLSRREGENDGRLSSVDWMDIEVLGGYPFQRNPEAVAATATMIAAEPIEDFSKEQVVSLPLNSGFSGTKRKLETPITECGDGTPSVNLSKKLQKKWSCSLCEVTTTGEKGLEDHFQGKKHKAKEKATLLATKTVNNNADSSESLAEVAKRSNELEMNDLEAVDHGVKQKADSESPNGGAEVSENQTPTESNSDLKYWCNTCKFGTTTEELMSVHRMGKQHVTLSQENGGGVVTVKTMPDVMEYVIITNGAAAEGKDEESGGENNQNADEA